MLEHYHDITDIETSAAALYDGGWRASDRDQLITEYDLTEEAANAICEELANIERVSVWYAVMTDRDDTDWGYGSHDRAEAEEMLAGQESPDAYIAVIVNNVCVEEIERS